MLNLITTEAEVVVPAEIFQNRTRELLDAALQKLEGNEFKVFYRLVQIMDSQYQAFELIKDIGISCKITSRSTIIKALNSLVAMGMVQRLGKKHQGYIYQISQIKNWTARPEKRSTKSVLHRLKAITVKACKAIQEMDFLPQEPESSTPPFRGGCADSGSPDAEVQKMDWVETPKNELPQEAEKLNFGEKVEILRQRGCNIGTIEQNNVKVVIVDHLPLSVGDFLQRPLESFNRQAQYCAEGVAMVKAKLAEIAQKHKIKAPLPTALNSSPATPGLS